MDDMRMMERTEVIIDGESAFVAQDQDLDELLGRIESAANGPAAFVEFIAVGNRLVRVLVTPRSRIVITSASVQYDSRDTGDMSAPFGGLFDLDADTI
jgi:hypothetical protein